MLPRSLPTWPPTLTHEQYDYLLLLSTTYALSHGFTLLPPNPTTPQTHTFAAPLSLFPSPFPRHLYDLAKEIQPVYNALYARIALDWDFLDRVMGGSVSKVDSFQGELWRGWRRVRDELVQVCRPDMNVWRIAERWRSRYNWASSARTTCYMIPTPSPLSSSSRSSSIRSPHPSEPSANEQETCTGT